MYSMDRTNFKEISPTHIKPILYIIDNDGRCDKCGCENHRNKIGDCPFHRINDIKGIACSQYALPHTSEEDCDEKLKDNAIKYLEIILEDIDKMDIDFYQKIRIVGGGWKK